MKIPYGYDAQQAQVWYMLKNLLLETCTKYW